MSKKIWIPIAVVVAAALIGCIVYLAMHLRERNEEYAAMQELAEMDKLEMENEYQMFANQYTEMMTRLTNDSLVEQLTAEQEKTQRLLDELKRVKSDDAREIARLKKELATVRAVLRSYVLEIDSLNRLNQNLMAENTRVREEYDEATKQIEGLSTEKATLTEKVAIAAQLDATGITLSMLNKNGKTTTSIKKCKTMQATFTVAKNVTAQSGMKTFYVRIVSPTGSVLGGTTSFDYENRSLKCTMKKTVEYGGQELALSLYYDVEQTLVAGTYEVSIFADGNMIGSKSIALK